MTCPRMHELAPGDREGLTWPYLVIVVGGRGGSERLG